jgi:glycosyltransferase involved in cell wall biosynthesis
VVSTGDAVGPFVAAQHAGLGPLFAVYERLLYRMSAGVIGWTPYIAGRALTFGAPRACTVPGWAPPMPSHEELRRARLAVRDRLAIPHDALVLGIVGSLAWSRRRGYCYGMELLKAAQLIVRSGVHVLIVGDGDGRSRLKAEARDAHATVHFTGRVARTEVPAYLAALDIGSLPQSRDRVGSFRYSTKLPEYLAAGVPVVTGRIPLAYDLDNGWLWALPGRAPWEPEYAAALADLIERITPGELDSRREAARRQAPAFAAQEQKERATAFLRDILAELSEAANGSGPDGTQRL